MQTWVDTDQGNMYRQDDRCHGNSLFFKVSKVIVQQSFYKMILLLYFFPQVHQTLLSQHQGCRCLSQRSPGCGSLTWRGLWLCWSAAASAGCYRGLPPRWRSRTQHTGSKHRCSVMAWRWRFHSWVGNEQMQEGDGSALWLMWGGFCVVLQTPASALYWRRRCLVTKSRSPLSARCLLR